MPTNDAIKERLSKLQFAPLKIEVHPEPELPQTDERTRPDLVISASWQGKHHNFVVECKSKATPREIEDAILMARSYADSVQGFLPMIVVPYLSNKALERLIEAGMSGLDLSGNGVINVPGDWFILRTGAKNQFPSSAPIKNIYRGTSSLVPRVFFAQQTFSSVKAVVEEIRRRGGKINFSTVSKALKALEDELIIGRETEIRLLQSERLLNLLVENYHQPKASRRVRGWVAAMDEALKKFAANAQEDKIFVVGSSPARYALMPGSEEVIGVYTSSLEKLLCGIDFREDERFPNMELIETDDQTVYFDRRLVDGFYWTPPLEVYLALATGGKRERETAEQLRGDLLRGTRQ